MALSLRLLNCYNTYTLDCILRVCRSGRPELLETYFGLLTGYLVFSPWPPGYKPVRVECEPLTVKEEGGRDGERMVGVRITATVEGQNTQLTFRSICYEVAGVLVCTPAPSEA